MAIILLVDDEALITKLVRTGLEKAGHSVHSAVSGREADKLALGLVHVDLLIIDHALAPENGYDIAMRLLQKYPAAKVMQMSGYPREKLEEEGRLADGAAFLSKPFRLSEMQDSVAALLRSVDRASVTSA